ncbi:hypothetical protein B0O80DRAFT_499599 [Mortierella sp. GBAus27b]|nr:hypothetical protein BGX31_006897 [Mortierella sp. GBA43]KAI8352300.1 hypothetical protein B0O80DRAFT_499599 [Mortierella sp. GBAus27b]
MFDIPELDDMILRQLTPYDLSQCVRVNKTWRSATTPYLWRDLTWLDNSSDPQRRAFRQLVVDDWRYEQRHRIQDQDLGPKLSSIYPQSILAKYRPWVQLLPNPIRLLQLPDHTQQPLAGQEPTVHELVLHLFKHYNTAQISQFCLDYGEGAPYTLKPAMEVVLPRVRHLSVQASYHGGCGELSELRYLLSQCSSTLEKLTLEVDFKYDDSLETFDRYDKDLDECEQEIHGPIEWTSLRELHLRPRGCIGTPQPPAFWRWVYKRCGQVERLEVSSFRRGASPSIAKNMLAHMPNLTEITIGNSSGRDTSTIREDRVATLLSGSRKGWKEVRLTGITRFGHDSMEALAKHFSTLEVLRIDPHYGSLAGDELVKVTSSCPKLHAIYCEANYYHFRGDLFIDQDPGTRTLRTWACGNILKTFVARVRGIPRPDLEENYTPEAHPGQGREMQSQIYDRLATFTNLETLWLGNTPYDVNDTRRRWVDIQRNCLEMSLESGIDKLSALKSLKELSVEGMVTKIGLQEVQWMTEHWPRLRLLHGLDREGDGKEAVEWLQTHHPEIELLRLQS